MLTALAVVCYFSLPYYSVVACSVVEIWLVLYANHQSALKIIVNVFSMNVKDSLEMLWITRARFAIWLCIYNTLYTIPSGHICNDVKKKEEKKDAIGGGLA